MSGMAYKISITALLYIAVVNSVEINQSSSNPILKSTPEAGLLPTIKHSSTPTSQYCTASTPPQQENIIIYGKPLLQPAAYIPQQPSTAQQTRIPQRSLFIQQPALVLQQATPIFQQAARILQPPPVLQYAIRIAVPQPVSVETNLSQSEGVPQYIRIVPQQEEEVFSPTAPQLVSATSQPQQGIQYAEEDDSLKYNEAVPVQLKPEAVAQTLQYNRIVPQLQQEQVVSHLGPASPHSVQVTSQQKQGIQYAQEDDKNVKYNEAVTAVPIQVKTEGVAKAFQYFRIIPQLHSSPASAQPVQVTSQPQEGIQYAEEDDSLKYNEAVPEQLKPEGVAQTLQYNRIVPQLQQEQVVSYLGPASPHSMQVTSQHQHGIQYDQEDDKNVKYNEAVTAVPIQVNAEGVAKAFQYFRIKPQLHSSPASPQHVQVTSHPQPGVNYAEEDHDVKYNEVVTAPVKVKPEDFDDNPQYTFGYDIEDISTGDSKQQSEQRIGNVVRGSYSVVDPDGYRRTVEYTVDANGFSAMVKRKPVQKGVTETKVAN